ELVRVGVLVVVDALHERGGAVADADDRYADLVLLVARLAVCGGRPVGGRSVAVMCAHERYVLPGSSGRVPLRARAVTGWPLFWGMAPPLRAPRLAFPPRQRAFGARPVDGPHVVASDSACLTCQMRCATVITLSAASTYTAGASRLKCPSEAPLAKIRPIERITTRTGLVAIPTLHSTPSASARARV